jgi:hypothetical protein
MTILRGVPMSRIRSVVLALGFLVVFVQGLAATNTWARHYPREGKNAGEIRIKGTATADTGFTLVTGTGAGTAIVWPRGRHGGIVTTFPIDVADDGTWNTTLTGLTAGKHYYVVVEVSQTMTTGCPPVTTTQTIATQPRTTEAEDDD